MIDVDRNTATETAAAAFRTHGVGQRDAEIVADALVRADARGKRSHGLIRLPRFVRGIQAGNVDHDGEITVVAERGSVATIDGGARLGPVVGLEANREATSRADELGIGVVGVRNANHLGMLGYYTDRLGTDGYVGIVTSNGESAMPAHGSSEPMLGTNPIAIGLPTDPRFNLDMATSVIARGDILHRRDTGERLPDGVALDADGEPTTDPDAALDGALRPIAGPKGSGLALAVEVLAGGLVGAAIGPDVTGTFHTEDPCTKGDLFVAIDPEAFGENRFLERVNEFLRDVKESEPAAGTEEIRLPGERSLERDAAADSIRLEADLWNEVQALARSPREPDDESTT